MELRQFPQSRRKKRRRQAGQTLVEFALVLPIMFTVVFGIIEFCFLFESIDTVNFAAREGAKVGAILGPTDVAADTKILQAIRNATSNGASLLFSNIKYIEIFKSDHNGATPPVLTSCAPLSGVNEDVYDGQGNQCGATQWPYTVRNATFNAADYLGVRITFSYNWVTSFVSATGGSLQMTSVSVQLIEPQSY